jgi:hypothetical protein
MCRVADHIINWMFNNILLWVALGLMVFAGVLLLGLIIGGIYALLRRNDGPAPIVLNPGEWDCVEWHDETKYVPPLLIGGAIYPQPSRTVTVADVYVRRGFRGTAGVAIPLNDQPKDEK